MHKAEGETALNFSFVRKSHHSVIGVISHIEYVENPFMSYKLWPLEKKKTSGPILEWKRMWITAGKMAAIFQSCMQRFCDDTVCKIYCRSMTRYVWFIAGRFSELFSELCVGYNSELERMYNSWLRYFIRKAEISNVKLENLDVAIQ